MSVFETASSSWRDSMDSARSFLSARVARLRELELEVSRKDSTLRKLKGSGGFQFDSPIVIGVCAMGKKATCKPMREILGRLPPSEFEIKIFEERVILEDPIECWPICDCLIAFYSTGFPQAKVESYVKLRKPFLVNDLEAQRLLWDRRTVYKICLKNEIPVPNHIVVNRDGATVDELTEGDDFVEVNGRRIYKPFVEKPVDADCHEVFIYYPKASGGGRKELFRKIGDRSSEFYPDRNNVRREGSFIYEEFLTTEGTDVKVYAVTMDYAHAEARKSPVMDGRVMRDENNVEVRYPVILSNYEKELARRVVKSFKQNVCGFDMLRSGGRSYVCDVNGWSFVKRSARYHKDSSLMLARVIRKLMGRPPPPTVSDSESDDSEDDSDELKEDSGIMHTSSDEIPSRVASAGSGPKKRHEELRAVIAIVRHGDRTPKQKLKIAVKDGRFLSLFLKYGKPEKKENDPMGVSMNLNAGSGTPPLLPMPSPSPRSIASMPEMPELKLKTAKELGDVLRITNEILLEQKDIRSASPMLYTTGSDIDEDPVAPANAEADEAAAHLEALSQVRAVLEMHGTFRGINRKIQLRCTKLSPLGQPAEAQLILKWGGVLTPPGRERAEMMGRSFRERMYPGIDGLIRLHSTYRHDLKIYASDEGRVQVTAAAFAKGLLDLEGHLTPILESLVKKGPEINGLLHDASQAQSAIVQAKQKLKTLLTEPQQSEGKADLPLSVQKALSSLPNGPIAAMSELHTEITFLAAQLKFHLRNGGKGPGHSRTRGSIVSAFRGLRGRSASISEKPILVDVNPNSPFATKLTSHHHPPPVPSLAEDGGAAAASLGSGSIDLDSNEDKIDRGDGAVSVRDLFHLACARWEKLQADFYRKENFDISKIPDIYDCAKYDITHNPEMLKLQPNHLLRVFELSKHLADAVVCQEYGESQTDKFEVGIKTCATLMGKIREDLRLAAEEGSSEKGNEMSSIDESKSVMTDPTGSLDGDLGLVEGAGYRLDRRLAKSMGIKNANRHVRTRLYFTSESHLHAVMNVLRFGHLANPSLPKPMETALKRLSEVEEMSYLCHIVFRLFEVTEPSGTKHHSLRVYISDGISVKIIEAAAPGEPVQVSVGTQSDKPNGLGEDMDEHSPIKKDGAHLHPSGFGFSSFNQNIPISPSTIVRSRSFGHSTKLLPPANAMIPLWLHLPLNDGLKLFDPSLIESVPILGPSAAANSTANVPKMLLRKGYRIERFNSSAVGAFSPSWTVADKEEDADAEEAVAVPPNVTG